MFKRYMIAIAAAVSMTGAVAAQAADISGAGATFPAPVYAKWVSLGGASFAATRCISAVAASAAAAAAARCWQRSVSSQNTCM